MAAAGGGALNPRLVKMVLVVMGLGIGGYILGPPLYWHLVEVVLGRSSNASSSGAAECPVCDCDCSLPLLEMPEELSNISFTDCAKHDPDVSEEMEKNFTDLLSEELKLREAEAAEKQQRADLTLLEAKKVVSQFQKEADKCNSAWRPVKRPGKEPKSPCWNREN
ncbi:unnamed protein product [Spirodela intermedia]|uniref:Uncharacterized protein n=1 Tax=Spirodela intermedia TaxID=51605 RepID=A0A7I8JIA3_SPIIN|nr:unnamed protein product [Spirodela intermedia]CAA6669876.1 unnamed protein product [Spirodela intermedia]